MAKVPVNKKELKEKRRFPGIFLMLLAILTLAFFGASYYKFDQTKHSEDGRGQVSGIDNSTEAAALLVVSKPQIVVTRGEQVFILENGEFDLLSGDVVVTDANGLGYIIFSDNSTLSLDGDTSVRIDEQKDKGDSFSVKITQFAGRTWSRVENLFGKGSEYSVETPNTIAAVRGTEFGCEVAEASTCYSIEHDISLLLKNTSFGEIVLPEGKEFKNDGSVNEKKNTEEVPSLFTDLSLEENEWKTFNICLSDTVEALLAEENNKNLDYLKLNKDEIGCGEVLGIEEEIPEESSPTLPKPVIKTVTDDGDHTILTTLNCKWTAANAKSYIYSIGTSAGKTDILGWKSTTKTNMTAEGLSLKYGQKYFCNVIAKGDGGNSSMKSSNGIYYDPSTGAFRTTNPCKDKNCNSIPNTSDQVNGTGNFLVAPLTDLSVDYYIKSTTGKYATGGTGWSNGIVWHSTSISSTGSSTFSFSGGTFGPGSEFGNAQVYFELKNKVTGKVLATKSVTLGSYSPPIIIF